MVSTQSQCISQKFATIHGISGGVWIFHDISSYWIPCLISSHFLWRASVSRNSPISDFPTSTELRFCSEFSPALIGKLSRCSCKDDTLWTCQAPKIDGIHVHLWKPNDTSLGQVVSMRTQLGDVVGCCPAGVPGSASSPSRRRKNVAVLPAPHWPWLAESSKSCCLKKRGLGLGNVLNMDEYESMN